MACTTILVGKKASNTGSTIIARNDDSPSGQFHVKKLVVVEPKDQPRHYKSIISHVEIELPDNPLRYTAMPNVDPKEGIWAASGVNSLNVGMTATETITTNSRVLGADPLVDYLSKEENNGVEKIGGIGEEDLVVLVLPYIKSAKEGVLRLGSLLEKYGTYESNGIAFSDEHEIWWLETIGGHHFIAKRVRDDAYITMPNQFGLDEFDLSDAFGKQKENICSKDLREFIKEHNLDLTNDESFNPRLAFGSHSDVDHIYNTPRAWYIERFLNPTTYLWDGEDADFTPISDDIPWSNVAERKITISDVKYLLSSHYQGTPYDPYLNKGDLTNKGMYRPIGISRTSFLSIIEIRNNVKDEIKAIEWFSFGSNVFNTIVPFFTNVHTVPQYYKNTTLTVDSNNFYWANRLIAAICDAHFTLTSRPVGSYQEDIESEGNLLVNKLDKNFGCDLKAIEDVNQEMADIVKQRTNELLDKVLYIASCQMKNGYSLSDN